MIASKLASKHALKMPLLHPIKMPLLHAIMMPLSKCLFSLCHCLDASVPMPPPTHTWHILGKIREFRWFVRWVEEQAHRHGRAGTKRALKTHCTHGALEHA